jgi:lipopolysaccharide transport system ATP-binding protein
MSYAVRVENLGKQYRLGLNYAGSIRELLNRLTGRLFGRKPVLSTKQLADLQHLTGNRLDSDGAFWALRDVSFEIQSGEVVGVIGRNGSGKSTLLKILSQITAPTAGRVELQGRVASLLEVGTGFHQELSGRENVFLNGAILGMTKAEIRRKFDEIVAFAEVERFIDTPVKRYSSGMQLRLAFAVAAHLEPEILVVDEVLAVGDASFQRKCLGKMDDVAHQGRTILFVSHDMGAVERLCRKTLLLNRGRMQAIGPTEQVVAEYLHCQESEHLDWVRAPASVPDHSYLARIRLCDEGGETLRVVTSATTVCVEVECEMTSDRPDIELAVALNDGNERPIFASNPIDAGQPYPTRRGRHRYRARFPGPVLMPQRYSLSVALYSRLGGGVDNCPHVLTFDVTPVASLANLGGAGRWGVLQLMCEWTHETM